MRPVFGSVMLATLLGAPPIAVAQVDIEVLAVRAMAVIGGGDNDPFAPPTDVEFIVDEFTGFPFRKASFGEMTGSPTRPIASLGVQYDFRQTPDGAFAIEATWEGEQGPDPTPGILVSQGVITSVVIQANVDWTYDFMATARYDGPLIGTPGAFGEARVEATVGTGQCFTQIEADQQNFWIYEPAGGFCGTNRVRWVVSEAAFPTTAPTEPSLDSDPGDVSDIDASGPIPGELPPGTYTLLVWTSSFAISSAEHSGASLITIAPVGACLGDCDGSGTVNVDDVDCFVAGFLGGELSVADCNGNGSLNVDDVDCFVAAFLAGCP